MMIEEFEKLTGIFPSAALYSHIEAAYMEFNGDKVAFCKAYKKNEDGLAEKIQRAANMEAFKLQTKAADEAAAAQAQISKLEKQLEREQEWKPYDDTNNHPQAEYDKLKADRDTQVLSDEEAKALLYDWYGFAKEKIRIHRTIPQYEVNRHRQLRQIGEIDRAPLYNATDWNYIRFDCGCMSYELVNDDLRPFLH